MNLRNSLLYIGRYSRVEIESVTLCGSSLLVRLLLPDGMGLVIRVVGKPGDRVRIVAADFLGAYAWTVDVHSIQFLAEDSCYDPSLIFDPLIDVRQSRDHRFVVPVRGAR